MYYYSYKLDGKHNVCVTHSYSASQCNLKNPGPVAFVLLYIFTKNMVQEAFVAFLSCFKMT